MLTILVLAATRVKRVQENGTILAIRQGGHLGRSNSARLILICTSAHCMFNLNSDVRHIPTSMFRLVKIVIQLSIMKENLGSMVARMDGDTKRTQT